MPASTFRKVLYYLLEALADPKNPDHDEMEESIGSSIDPTAFSLDEVNAQFEQIGDIAELAKARRQNSLLSVDSFLLEPLDAQDALSAEPWPDVRDLAGLLDMHGVAPKPRAISLDHLGYAFTTPPLLIGGRAMEWYGLRTAGADIDFVVTRADYDGLAALHPEHLKDLRGDLGVVVEPFELWTSIYRFDYDALASGAQDIGAYRVISLEKLLLLKSLGINEEKNALDVLLICSRILDQQYGKA